jgi:hypothetical protein
MVELKERSKQVLESGSGKTGEFDASQEFPLQKMCCSFYCIVPRNCVLKNRFDFLTSCHIWQLELK